MTYSATHRPSGPAFPIRGVFPADPHNPPVPPADAIASEFVDQTGAVIAYVWVVQKHHDKATVETQWGWLDQKDPSPTSSADPYGPRLVP